MDFLSKLTTRLSEFDPTQYFDEALGVLVILIIAWVLMALSRRAIRIFAQFAVRNSADPEDSKRVATLSRVFRYLSTVTIVVLTIIMVLGQVGISIAPILGAAGVVGIAVGFGAQSIVKDFFTGFTILLENKIRQGDVVRVAGIAGLVEGVTLRTVRLRDYDGNVHFVPTGMIETVTNMSMEFSNAVMDIGVAYRENVDDVYAVMRETALAMRADPAFEARILGDLDIAGVEQWADSAVVIRCRLKCRPLDQWIVRRDYLRRLKQAFDERGIEIPFPHVTVYAGEPKTGVAPSLPLRMESGSALQMASDSTAGGR